MDERELPFPEGYYHYDKSNMKKILDEFPIQVRQASELVKNIQLQKASVVYWVGMGGSGIAGLLLQCYLRELEMHLVNNYDLPEHIPEDAMIIICSYSGNTEETLSCFKQAARKFKNIITLSAGGKLAELAEMNRTPHLALPKGFHPRNTVPLQFFAALKVLEQSETILPVASDIKTMLEKIDMKQIAGLGLELSKKLKDKVMVCYSSQKYYSLALRWKREFNENAKVMAFSAEFPELNHHEIMGYTFLKSEFYAILLKFDDDHRRIQKRMELSKNIMKKAGVEVTEIALKGPLLTKIFTCVLIGDYTSYYLGLSYKIDPSQDRMLDKFKADLGPWV